MVLKESKSWVISAAQFGDPQNPIYIQIRRRFVYNIVPLLPVARKSYLLLSIHPHHQRKSQRDKEEASKNGSHGCTSELHDLSFPLLQFLLGPTPLSSYSLPSHGTLSYKSSKPFFVFSILLCFVAFKLVVHCYMKFHHDFLLKL